MPPPQVGNVQEPYVCQGYDAEINISLLPFTIYQWYYSLSDAVPFFTGPTLVVKPSGTTTYWVEPEDTSGCPGYRVPVTANIYPLPLSEATIHPKESEIPHAAVEFQLNPVKDNIVNVLWDFGDGNTSDQTDPVHQYTAEGVYTVTLTMVDSNGCE